MYWRMQDVYLLHLHDTVLQGTPRKFSKEEPDGGKHNLNAREYLEQYKFIEARVNILQAEVERLRTDAEGMSINLDGMPKGSGRGSKFERLAIQLAECEARLQGELSDLWRLRIDIIENLNKLADHKHQTLLYGRYIEGKTWETIAYEMKITWRHCYRLHGHALQKLEKIIH